MLIKLYSFMAPDYFISLFQGSDAIQYNRNYCVIYTRRTSLFEHSFVPSPIDLWNKLTEHLRNISTISFFKQFQRSHIRFTSTYLYSNHESDTNKCELCDEIKTDEHYFFRCNRFVKVILCACEHICSIVRYCFRSFKQL